MPLTVSDAERSELAVTYAALILNDDKVDITEENINKILSASNNKVEPYWPKLFAKLLNGKDVDEILLAGGAGGPGSGPATGGGAAPEEEKKEEAAPVEEEEEESEEEDADFDLFD